uniref:Transposase n=1 Tax=Meloidogyne javanica TaxID=6303 RepID=A0A915MI86_MELJA
MPKAISIEIKKLIVEAKEQGKTNRVVAQEFNVSIDSVIKFYKEYKTGGALPKRRSKKIPCNLGRVETRSQLSPKKTPNLNICKVEIGHYNSSNYLQNNFRDMLDRELLTDCVIK